MLERFLDLRAQLDWLRSIQSGAFLLSETTVADLGRCSELLTQYADLRLGLADAAVVATAERLGIPTILTVDLRHFRVVQSKLGALRLPPADL